MTEQEKAQKIMEVYQSLPSDLQFALTNSDISNKVQTIGNRHNLHIDKISMLELEVMLVLLGIERVSEFVSSITKQLQISPSEADAIASDVHTVIFNSVKESLVGIESELVEDDKTDKPATTDQNTDIDQLESHAEILHAIENPDQYKTPSMITPKTTIRVSPDVQKMMQPNPKPMGTPSNTPNDLPGSTPSQIPRPASATSQKPISNNEEHHDPYREPFN